MEKKQKKHASQQPTEHNDTTPTATQSTTDSLRLNGEAFKVDRNNKPLDVSSTFYDTSLSLFNGFLSLF